MIRPTARVNPLDFYDLRSYLEHGADFFGEMETFIFTDLPEHLQRQIKDKVEKVFFYRPTDGDAVLRFSQSEILMGNPPREWLSHMNHRLKFWQLDSAGFDQFKHVKTDAVVANMGDFFSRRCAETMIAGILSFYRGLNNLAVLQREKRWVGRPLRYNLDMLTRKRIIILGAGTIAQHIRQLLSGFECDVKFVARTNPQAAIRSREQLIHELPHSDVLINTLPGSAGKYVSHDVLSSMKPDGLYASVGRGSTTDEAALIDAIVNKSIAGAVLDVTDQEPLPESSPLWKLQNVILTQHTGGGYRYEDEGKVQQFLENLERYLKGEPVQNRITLSNGY